MDDDLIAVHSDTPKLMHFLHLPVRSGSDKVLREMNRQYTADFYLEKISALRAVCGNIAFSSYFIVGHPGETDQDFQQTLQLFQAVKFAQAVPVLGHHRPVKPRSRKRLNIKDCKCCNPFFKCNNWLLTRV